MSHELLRPSIHRDGVTKARFGLQFLGVWIEKILVDRVTYELHFLGVFSLCLKKKCNSDVIYMKDN